MPVAQTRVMETAPASPAEAERHFAARLAFETDPWDVNQDLQNGVAGFVLLDARSPESFAKLHIKGALNLWHRQIDEAHMASYSKDTVFVTYCTGVGCNASTKAALRLSKLGFKVKEMTGGLKWWKDEGFPVEGSQA